MEGSGREVKAHSALDLINSVVWAAMIRLGSGAANALLRLASRDDLGLPCFRTGDQEHMALHKRLRQAPRAPRPCCLTDAVHPPLSGSAHPPWWPSSQQLTKGHQEQHSEARSAPSSEPHLIFVYEDRQILEDAAALISYYVKRQPAIQKEDQGTIHQLLHQFVPSLFFSQQLDLGASEESADEDRDSSQGQSTEPSERKKPAPGPHSSPPEEKGAFGDSPAAAEQPPPPPQPLHKALDDVYSLFFANNNWYFFLRLHQTLCSRLLKIYRQAQKQLLEYRTEKEREKLLCEGRREKGSDPAMELRLKQPSEVELEEYYPAFLDMVRSLLEGSIDPTQYEDTLREMFTIHAYVGFTMDKLVQNIARQVSRAGANT
ncbi:Paired amphipathic helix protein Sin3b [Saguinus oedipus]|uniref:Paired amphipathic helix protein Sin3b n=1 Tax=Saguinus oedipus TaxID=9490 RepID=A0ABQ9TS65_SAGOE|nr:Paired amphipathic helix protein Sin3b [Saguinus oedipus]